MLRLCIAGKNSIAVNALKFALKHLASDEICIVSNANDIGLDSWQPSLLKVARNLNVRVCTLQEVQDLKNITFISLEFDKIIDIHKFQTKELYNIHFSALPKYKGCFTSITPILNGESQSGVTLHRIDNGIDTGEICAQKMFKIDLQDSARDLYFKYLKFGFLLFCEYFETLLCGKLESQKQSNLNASYFSRKELDLNLKINLNKTSFEIHNQLRAFIFKEYQLPKIQGLSIEKSILSDELIAKNTLQKYKNKFIIAGIDGFKIEAFLTKN